MKKIAYTVLSCDNYADVWEPYGLLMKKFWPDCPFDKYFATNEVAYSNHGFESILLGPDISWGHGLKTLVTKLIEMEYEYAFIAFDDFLLIDKVNNEKLISIINNFLSINGNSLRMIPYNSPKKRRYNNYFAEVYNGVPYRMTLGFNLWNLNTLNLLINENESAWEFEKNGVIRSFEYDGFYCTYKSQFKYINLIMKRKLVKDAYITLKNILPNTNIRREIWDARLERLKGYPLYFFLRFFPAKLQNKIYFEVNKSYKFK